MLFSCHEHVTHPNWGVCIVTLRATPHPTWGEQNKFKKEGVQNKFCAFFLQKMYPKKCIRVPGNTWTCDVK